MNADKALELARKAYPNNEELRVAYMLGLNEGYELHKDEMMKEVIEGEYDSYPAAIYLETPIQGIEHGGKVRIIVLPKED